MSRLEFTETGIRRLTVENLGSGSLVVTPTDGDKLSGTIDCSEPDYPFADAVRFDGGHVRITLPQTSRTFFRDVAVDIAIQAPAGVDFTVTSGSAEVSIGSQAGRVRVTIGSGDVHIESAEEVQLTSGSGDVSIGTVSGSSSRLNSGSGDLYINDALTSLSAKSGSGDIHVANVRGGRFQGNTASGDISVPSTTGSLDLRTASGSLSIGVAENLPAWLDLDSVSGDIQIDLEATEQPSPGDPYVAIKGRTASGDIAVFRA